jgi:hypothetical protein
VSSFRRRSTGGTTSSTAHATTRRDTAGWRRSLRRAS